MDTCFELSVGLLRVIELIVAVAPQLFTDANRPNSEILLNRLMQLLSQVSTNDTAELQWKACKCSIGGRTKWLWNDEQLIEVLVHTLTTQNEVDFVHWMILQKIGPFCQGSDFFQDFFWWIEAHSSVFLQGMLKISDNHQNVLLVLSKFSKIQHY